MNNIKNQRVLVIAPHPDDETLGVGGTIAKYVEAGAIVKILTVSGHMPPLYSEADYRITQNEAQSAYEVLGVGEYAFFDYPATLLNEVKTSELNGKIYNAIADFNPTIVFSPYPDRHVDHRIIFDSVMVAARPIKAGKSIKILAAYETLSETHWNASHIEPNFVPTWIVDISETIEKKLSALSCFESQIPAFPGPRCSEAVKSLAVFRGTQAGFGYGEAFHIIRMVQC